MDQLLRIFIQVVEEKNFTKAAEQLHMTQPAVSQAVKNLESRLNTSLIDRVNKEFHLNQAGTIVYELGKEIHAKLDKMEQLVKELHHEIAGEVIIGASYTIGEYIMPQLLAILHERYPKVHAHIIIGNTKDIGDKLSCREIDLGFIEGTYEHDNILATTFMEEEMYVCSSIQHSDNYTAATLSDEVWLAREVGSGTRHMQMEFMEAHDIHPKQCITLGSTQLIKEAIQAGLGISLMSETVVAKELATGRIKRVNFQHELVTRNFSFIKHRSSFEPKINRVIEEIVPDLWRK